LSSSFATASLAGQPSKASPADAQEKAGMQVFSCAMAIHGSLFAPFAQLIVQHALCGDVTLAGPASEVEGLIAQDDKLNAKRLS
jgi:hypothetical protein